MKFRKWAVLVAFGVMLVGIMSAVPAGATAAPKPTVSGLASSLTTLYDNGGTVTLSATVTNARSCLFSSNKSINGLPASLPCDSGEVFQAVTLPANTGKKGVSYTFKLAVIGATKTVKATSTKVTVGTTQPPPTTASPLSADPSTLTSAGGSVGLTDDVVDGLTCTFSSTPSVVGLPATLPCAAADEGAVDIVSTSVNVPANLGPSTIDYLFTMTATGVSTATTNTSIVVPSTPLTTVSPLSANLSTFTNVGGTVTLTDDVTNGLTCALSSTPTIAGLPVTFPCAGATQGAVHIVSTQVTLPANPGPSAESYTVTMTASGTTTATTSVVLVVQPPPLTGASAIASGSLGYCAVLTTGGVECWGDNSYGELGNGTIGGPDSCGLGNTCDDTPQAVTGITNATAVVSGGNSYCAVLSTGGVECWGDNSSGELGNGTMGGPACEATDGCSDTPQVVTGVTDAVSVTADQSGSFCALLSTGGADCWGNNRYGELGDGSTGGPDSCYDGDQCDDSAQVVVGLSDAATLVDDGYGTYCALLSTGGVVCWGDDERGEVGNGSSVSPESCYGDDPCYDSPQAVIGVTDAVSVVSDGWGYCAVLSTGAVECWGFNVDGQVGNGTVTGPGSAYGYDTPQSVVGITNAVSVASDGAGEGYCAVLSTGGVTCWGNNSYGELGNGSIGGPDSCFGSGDGCDATPQAVIGITNATSVVNDGKGFCAVLSTGGMVCWGSNLYGALGTGTTGGPDSCFGSDECYDTPQPVVGITDPVSVVSDGGGFSTPDGGGYCALLPTGEVNCWGQNAVGQVGTGTIDGPGGTYGYDTPQTVL